MNIKDLFIKVEHIWVHISHTFMWVAVLSLTLLAWYGIRDHNHLVNNAKVLYQNELILRDKMNADKQTIVNLQTQLGNLQHEVDMRDQVQTNIIKALTIHAKEIAHLNQVAESVQKDQNHSIFLQE